jgi:hypothetical protein
VLRLFVALELPVAVRDTLLASMGPLAGASSARAGRAMNNCT